MIPLQVILDTFDAGHILCRNPQSAALLLVLDKSPEMDDAILHNDVFQGQVRPRFRREPSEKLFANSAVINAGRFGNFDRRQVLQQVARVTMHTILPSRTTGTRFMRLSSRVVATDVFKWWPSSIRGDCDDRATRSPRRLPQHPDG